MRIQGCLWLIPLTLCLAATSAFGQEAGQAPVSVITNTASSLQSVRVAISDLEKTSKPPKFWASIANDTMYSVAHRRLCILELFHRFAQPGMRIREVTTLLEGQKWLQTNHVDRVDDVVGLTPVKMTPDDSIFVIRILPQPSGDTPAVYLRMKGKVERRDFFQILSGQVSDPKLAASELLEIGFSEP